MADPNPAPIGLAVKLPFATPEEFLARYGTNITRGGLFLRSKAVKPPGTAVTLELRLSDGSRLLYASAIVHFVTGQGGSGISAMGVKFLGVDPPTRKFLETQVAQLPHANTSQPPLPPEAGPATYAATPAPPPNAPVVAGASAKGPTAPPFEMPTEEPKREGPVIGIDLGTTNSCVAFVKGTKPSVLTSREGYNTVPSIIALNARGRLVIGHPAKGQMLTNPRQTVYGAKRLIGRQYDSEIVQQIKDRFHYEVAKSEDGEAAVVLGDRTYSLQQISALVLREVRELAQNQLAQPVSRAVITVPAYYSDSQRNAVREAGRLAGLHVERILNEPTAAALAYGFGRKLTQRVLVYDLGGGTFDASVLELNDNVYEVVSTGGDTFLGGIDFDNAIVQHLLAEFERVNGMAFQGDRVALQRISDAAERAKCQLSERSETRVNVPFVTMIDNKPLDLDATLTREKLVALTGPLVERTLQVCQEVLAAKGLSPKDVDEVILVGGQSRFPLVHEKITALFGKPPSKGVHPDEAVAMGAALLASSLGQVEGVVLIDVLPMAIGIGLPGGRFKPVLERNTSLPATKRYTIATTRDDQRELELTIFQGDSDRAERNEFLGTLTLSGLPEGARGTVRVTISFEVNNESLLKVTAREESTGKEVSTTLTTRHTPEEIKKKLAEAQIPVTAPPEPPKGEAAPADGPKKEGGLWGFFRRLFGRKSQADSGRP